MNDLNPVLVKGERERKIRTVVRMIVWRIIGALLTFGISWLITKNFSISFSIFFFREAIAITIYYIHERIWNKIRWGKFRLEKLNVPPNESA